MRASPLWDISSRGAMDPGSGQFGWVFAVPVTVFCRMDGWTMDGWMDGWMMDGWMMDECGL